MFFGLFKSKSEKLKEEIKKKYNRDDYLWEIQRLRNSKEELRRNDDDEILKYILLYGFMQDVQEESNSAVERTQCNPVESNIIQPAVVSETSDYSSSYNCQDNSQSKYESNSSYDYTPSYSSSSDSYSSSSSSDSSSSSSCD